MAMATSPQDLSIGKRIRWARKRAGLSQENLALAVGTSRRHVIRWENDSHAPGPVYRERIAEATGQEAEMFSDGDEEEEDADLAADLYAALMAIIDAKKERVA